MLKIELELDQNLTLEISRSVETFATSVSDTIASVLPNRIEQVFITEGTRDGEGETWIPTSKVARAKRKSGNINAPTLTDTGALSNSIQANVQKLPDGMIVVISSPLSYASIMQNGGEISVGKRTYTVPSRPFLFFTRADEELIDNIVKDTPL